GNQSLIIGAELGLIICTALSQNALPDATPHRFGICKPLSYSLPKISTHNQNVQRTFNNSFIIK
ncbi:MAG: hypothetical protein ACP5K7_12890, partial [Verrucomicrobiia bacterium]